MLDSDRLQLVRIETQDDSPRASLISAEDYNSVTGILKRRELTSKERKKESGPLKPGFGLSGDVARTSD